MEHLLSAFIFEICGPILNYFPWSPNISSYNIKNYDKCTEIVFRNYKARLNKKSLHGWQKNLFFYSECRRINSYVLFINGILRTLCLALLSCSQINWSWEPIPQTAKHSLQDAESSELCWLGGKKFQEWKKFISALRWMLQDPFKITAVMPTPDISTAWPLFLQKISCIMWNESRDQRLVSKQNVCFDERITWGRLSWVANYIMSLIFLNLSAMKGKERKKYSKVRGSAHVLKGYNSETLLFTKKKLLKTTAPHLSQLSPCLRGRGITAYLQAQEYTLHFVAKLWKNRGKSHFFPHLRLEVTTSTSTSSFNPRTVVQRPFPAVWHWTKLLPAEKAWCKFQGSHITFW